MRDTIRGIVGKLRKGIDGYILVTVNTDDYTIHTYYCMYVLPFYLLDSDSDTEIIVGWYHDPIKMSVLRDQIERKIRRNYAKTKISNKDLG